MAETRTLPFNKLFVLEKSKNQAHALIENFYSALSPLCNSNLDVSQLENKLAQFAEKMEKMTLSFTESMKQDPDHQSMGQAKIHKASNTKTLLQMAWQIIPPNTTVGKSYQEWISVGHVDRLLNAMQHGHGKIVTGMLCANKNLEEQFWDDYGVSPLIMAAYLGNEKVVEDLINFGANVNEVGVPLTIFRDFPQFCSLGISQYAKNMLQRDATALIVAAINNHQEVVAMLLQAGADPDVFTSNILPDEEHHSDMTSPFWMLAVADGWDDSFWFRNFAMELLFHSSKLINIKHWDLGCTALMLAAEQGQARLVRTLISAGAQLNILHDYSAATAITYGAKNGHLDVVKILIEAGALLDVDSTFGTELIAASRSGDVCIVEDLIQSGASLDFYSHLSNSTALSAATAENQFDIVSLLVQNGANLNVCNAGSAALIAAVMANHSDLIILLVRKGVDVDACSSGCCALSIAAQNANFSIVNILLEAGASFDQWRSENSTDASPPNPLWLAVSNNDLAIAQLLLEFGFPLNVRHFGFILKETIDQQQAGCVKSPVNRWEMIKLLLDAGICSLFEDNDLFFATIEHSSVEFCETFIFALKQQNPTFISSAVSTTALMVAIKSGRKETVNFLLESFAHLNCNLGEAPSGTTPLMAAIWSNKEEMLMHLIHIGADINLQNSSGATPLMIAGGLGHLGALRILIEADAQLNIQDSWGNTPLSYALAFKQHTQTDSTLYEVVLALLKAGIHPSNDNNNLIMMALLRGNLKVACCLYQAGAVWKPCAYKEDKLGWNALHWLVISCARENEFYLSNMAIIQQIAQLILESGVAVSTKDRSGTTPVQLAALCNCSVLVHFFLSFWYGDFPCVSENVAGSENNVAVTPFSGVHFLDYKVLFAFGNPIDQFSKGIKKYKGLCRQVQF